MLHCVLGWLPSILLPNGPQTEFMDAATAAVSKPLLPG